MLSHIQIHFYLIKVDELEGDKGIILIQTNSHVVFGSYKSGMSPSVCIEACEKLGN